MTKYYQRPASEVGIRVGYHRGFEKHGRTFVTTRGCDAVGGQCSKCHTIVWANSRLITIFNRPAPPGIPTSGPGYAEYAKSIDIEFLRSLSPCPKCSATESFDLLVTNISLARYEDGTEQERVIGKEYYDTLNPNEAWVWWTNFGDK